MNQSINRRLIGNFCDVKLFHMATVSVVRFRAWIFCCMSLSLPVFPISLHCQLSNGGSNDKEINSERKRKTFFFP